MSFASRHGGQQPCSAARELLQQHDVGCEGGKAAPYAALDRARARGPRRTSPTVGG
jgi:hypothetical protein